MFVTRPPRLSCESCIKPIARRLALFQAKDEYECYAESYVKCFWGLCDLHRSDTELPNVVKKIVTEQPTAQMHPFNNYNIIQDLALTK